MAITLQSASTKGGAYDSSNASTTPITLPVSPTTGNRLILAVGSSVSGGTSVSSITGGGVTTWTKRAGDTFSAGTAPTLEIWEGVVDTTPSTSITVTWAAKLNGTKWWGYGEFVGITAFDSASAKNTATSTAPATNSYTNTIADELLIAAYANGSTSTPSTGPSNSFSDLYDGVDSVRGRMAYKIKTSVASDSTGWTMVTSRNWITFILGWKGTSAAFIANPPLLITKQARNRASFH